MMWQHVCNGKVCFKLMQSMNKYKYRLKNRHIDKQQSERHVCCAQYRMRLSQGVCREIRDGSASS